MQQLKHIIAIILIHALTCCLVFVLYNLGNLGADIVGYTAGITFYFLIQNTWSYLLVMLIFWGFCYWVLYSHKPIWVKSIQSALFIALTLPFILWSNGVAGFAHRGHAFTLWQIGFYALSLWLTYRLLVKPFAGKYLHIYHPEHK